VPGLGEVTVFEQNTSLGEHAKEGDEVYLSWQVGHAFGLAEPPPAPERFLSDTDTASVAVQEREKLETELEGA
jgi:spermidine/putrescine transport system ATP-binding protein